MVENPNEPEEIEWEICENPNGWIYSRIESCNQNIDEIKNTISENTANGLEKDDMVNLFNDLKGYLSEKTKYLEFYEIIKNGGTLNLH